MAKSENQKQKLLTLKEFFEQETDEAHPAGMSDIIAYLAARDISAERKSIYSDIQTLQDFGMDIVAVKGKTGGYFLGSREFELAELKLLVDAVQSSRFLTDKKSLSLIKKLSSLVSRHEATQLRRQVVVSGRVKTMNESIYYSIDRIHEAIAGNVQIQFRYFDWAVDGSRQYRARTQIASPYALCWDNANYYLISHTDQHGITHYRVDKMDAIELIDQPRIRTQETQNLNLASYAKKMFGMFNGEETVVKMRFDNRLAGVVIDRFGHDSIMVPDGDSHFTFTTSVVRSPQFLGWLAGLGNQVQILYPQSMIDTYTDMLRASLAQYQAI